MNVASPYVSLKTYRMVVHTQESQHVEDTGREHRVSSSLLERACFTVGKYSFVIRPQNIIEECLEMRAIPVKE